MTDIDFSTPNGLWKAYRSIKMETWGPQRLFGGVSTEPIASLLGDGLASFVQNLPDDIKLGGLKPGHKYVVHDAATAALLLHLNQELSLMRGSSPPIYRGQADHPDWTIQASVDRTNRPGQEHEHLTQLFGAMIFDYILQMIDWQVGEWLPKGWHLDELTISAMARHHGMSSALIDLTVDPSVAVMFAHEQAIEAKTEMARVFRFDIHDLGEEVALSLTPPPVLRSARQHGVYYQSLVRNGSACEPQIDKAVIVCFPTTSPSIYNHELLRDGEAVDLMHADPLLELIETHVRNYMRVMPTGAIQDEYLENSSVIPCSLSQMGLGSLLLMTADKILTRDGKRFRYHPNSDVINEWFSLTTDILHALFGICHVDGKTLFHLDIIDRFVRQNYVVLQIYLHYFLRIFRGTPLEGLVPIIRIINTKLLEVSDGNVGVYSPDLIQKGANVIPGEVRSTPWTTP